MELETDACAPAGNGKPKVLCTDHAAHLGVGCLVG